MDAFDIRPIILTLLHSSNGATLILLLASIFNLSFLTRSSEMIYIEALMLIKVGKSIPAILMYTFNSCINLCCLEVKA